MFWWAVVRSRIWLTLANNTLTLKHAVVVTGILASYEIDWASLIVENIHEATLKRSTYIPFPCLIHRLYLESRVKSLHQLDSLVEVQRTLDANLIKDKENLIALWQAHHQYAFMPEMLDLAPSVEVSHTTIATITASTTEDQPSQTEADKARGPTTSIPAP